MVLRVVPLALRAARQACRPIRRALCLAAHAMPSEAAVGITAFSTPGPGFLATTKQRYSDFIVREVDPVSGLPVRLTALPEAPKAPATDASKDDASTIEADLAAVIGEEHAKLVMALLQLFNVPFGISE